MKTPPSSIEANRLDRLLAFVGALYCRTPAEIIAPGSLSDCAEARWLVARAAHDELGISLSTIGFHLGQRDHSCFSHGLGVLRNRARSCKGLTYKIGLTDRFAVSLGLEAHAA